MDDSVGARVADDWATPILPERGLVFSEVKYMQLQLCKPKLLPIKSYSLEKLEKMEKKLVQEAKEKREGERAIRQSAVGWTSPDLRDTAPPAIPASPPRAGPAIIVAPKSSEDGPSSLSPSPDTRTTRRTTSAGAGDEDASADAPMSPHEHSTLSGPGSDVSASSQSTTEYD